MLDSVFARTRGSSTARCDLATVPAGPQLAALLSEATDPGVLGGQYYGPSGIGEVRGYPKVVESSGRSHDVAAQRRLWEVSERLTGVTFAV